MYTKLYITISPKLVHCKIETKHYIVLNKCLLCCYCNQHWEYNFYACIITCKYNVLITYIQLYMHIHMPFTAYIIGVPPEFYFDHLMIITQLSQVGFPQTMFCEYSIVQYSAVHSLILFFQTVPSCKIVWLLKTFPSPMLRKSSQLVSDLRSFL